MGTARLVGWRLGYLSRMDAKSWRTICGGGVRLAVPSSALQKHRIIWRPFYELFALPKCTLKFQICHRDAE